MLSLAYSLCAPRHFVLSLTLHNCLLHKERLLPLLKIKISSMGCGIALFKITPLGSKQNELEVNQLELSLSVSLRRKDSS